MNSIQFQCCLSDSHYVLIQVQQMLSMDCWRVNFYMVKENYIKNSRRAQHT